MEKKDSLLMLKYMISEGFNPNNYERILELLQSAPLSLSKILKEYNPGHKSYPVCCFYAVQIIIYLS